MAKIAKTGDRKKVMDTTKSTDCPKCSKPTRIVKRVKDRERGIPGGVYISCSACDFYEKLPASANFFAPSRTDKFQNAKSSRRERKRIAPGEAA